jgi:hypothetical protein
LAFFASRFSFSDLLAAVFELFEPPLSLLAMVTSFRRRDPELTVSPGTPRTSSSTPRGEPERVVGAGQMEAGRANERRESLAFRERHGDHQAGRRGNGPAHDFHPALEIGEGGPSGPPSQRSTVQTR